MKRTVQLFVWPSLTVAVRSIISSSISLRVDRGPLFRVSFVDTRNCKTHRDAEDFTYAVELRHSLHVFSLLEGLPMMKSLAER